MSGSPIGTATAASSDVMTHDGLRFRDLDHDGLLAPYEDWRLSARQRADDLLGRMTIEEKVGLMLHGTAPAVGSELARIGIGTGYDLGALDSIINVTGVNCMISRLSIGPEALAAQSNAVQTVAAGGRLGIPVTFSTDPRSHFATVTGASVDTGGFSQWPETLGLAALRDPALVRRFGDVIRQEYRAVGFHVALSPQADLATAPRWPRIEGTFGQDPALVRSLVGAYVEGVQGGIQGAARAGVAAVVKHWVGYGASRDGFDGHNHYGRHSSFPSGRFQDHVDAFLDAFAAKVAGVMPTYNILEGLSLAGVPVEQVGAGFNRQLITDLLRGTYGYDGLILSDWSITKDMTESCRTGNPVQTPQQIAMPWGVEELTRAERFAKAVDAGLDQFGGEDDPQPLLKAVGEGRISAQRIDQSAHRVLVQKFELGLFDDPFVDPEAAASVVGRADFAEEGRSAQRRSLVRLKHAGAAPPVARGDAVHVDGMDTEPFVAAGLQVVGDVRDADVAVFRLTAPHQLLHPGHFFGRMQHEGDLDFKDGDPDLARLEEVSAAVPTIVVIHLDRPAILSNVVDRATWLYAEFGASPDAVVDVLLGDASADGSLPFALPASMDAVCAHPCDAATDQQAPLYPLFFRT